MSNYTKTTNFATKDSLPSGDPNKIVKGAEINTEFDNIATAVSTKSNSESPTFTGTVTIPTADINGGAIDGTTIGGTTAASITGTTLTANTSLNIAGDGATVTGIKDEDDMASNSATKLATQQSIKAYVDSQVTAQDLDVTTDSGTISIDLDSETLTVAGGTGLDSSATGNTVTLGIDSTVATLTGTQTLTNKTLTAPVISGNLTTDGTIDGRDVATDGAKLDNIEANATADQTAAEIRTLVASATDSNVFTDADHSKLDGIEASADVTDTANVTAAGALMDSEVTNLAQVKAFDSADYATAAQGTTADSALQNVVEDTTPQLGGNLDLNSNNITGTGNIDVTGTVSADGLTVTGTLGNWSIDSQGVIQTFTRPSANYIKASHASGSLMFQTGGANNRLNIASNGDISFYEDTGTTPKFFWDASAESLGIGTTSPQKLLEISSNSSPTVRISNTRSDSNWDTDPVFGALEFYSSDVSGSGASVRASVKAEASTAFGNATDLVFRNGDSNGVQQENLRIDYLGRVGIGTSSPAQKLHISGSGTQRLRLTESGSGTYLQLACASSATAITASGADSASGHIHFATGVGSALSEAMRIDSSGNVGIGTTSPSFVTGSGLEIQRTSADATLRLEHTGQNGFELTAESGQVTYNSVSSKPHAFEVGGTERMRIDSSGRVGIGTSSPESPLHVAGDIRLDNTSYLRSETSSGGAVRMLGINASNVAYVGAIDSGATSTIFNASSTSNTASFYTAGSEKMRIDSSGSVGIGTSSPSFKLDVAGNARASYFALRSNESAPSESSFIYRPATGVLGFGTGTAERMRIDSSGNLLVGTTDQYALNGGFTVQAGTVDYISVGHASSVAHGNYYAAFRHGTNTIGAITQNGTSGVSYNTSSDERLKENIKDAEDAGSKIDAIQVRQFDWKADGSHQDYGVIAQELIEVAPEAVTEGETEDDMMAVDYSKLVPTLIKEIQTLRNRVAQLENN